MVVVALQSGQDPNRRLCTALGRVSTEPYNPRSLSQLWETDWEEGAEYSFFLKNKATGTYLASNEKHTAVKLQKSEYKWFAGDHDQICPGSTKKKAIALAHDNLRRVLVKDCDGEDEAQKWTFTVLGSKERKQPSAPLAEQKKAYIPTDSQSKRRLSLMFASPLTTQQIRHHFLLPQSLILSTIILILLCPPLLSPILSTIILIVLYPPLLSVVSVK